MKTPLALATAALALGVLAGCGGGSDDYCNDLKNAQDSFGSLSGGDVAKLDDAFKTFHKLAAEAPKEVKDDWKVLDGAMGSIEKAFKDAGIKGEDFAKLQQGQIPEGVDVTKLQSLGTEFSKLTGSELTDASKSIEKHAQDVCKVKLS